MERTKSEKRKCEWDAMSHLAKTYPKKYQLSIGVEKIYLWELSDFKKEIIYWISVTDQEEVVEGPVCWD